MTLQDHEAKSIGDIGNYYGCLEVKVENGVSYWSIENWNGHGWEEIPSSLYKELIKFEDGEK